MQVAGDYAVVDYVPPIGPVEIAIKLGQKPKRVLLHPGERELSGTWTNGIWSGAVDHVDVHSIVAFDDAVV